MRKSIEFTNTDSNMRYYIISDTRIYGDAFLVDSRGQLLVTSDKLIQIER